jgi:hypothetical protein
MSPEPSETLQQAAENVKEKIGTRPLSDDEILVLACEEIARTYSREEKGYI